MAVVSKDQAVETPNRIGDGPKTCHQCRQKRSDIVGSCVTKKKNSTCPIKYCPKCLVNRYGEKAEEVAVKTDWTCHKCRGNCNCSLCMKKQGKLPTGILVHTAKATGFSSVSELLKSSGSDQYFYKKKVKPEDAAVVVVTPQEESVVQEDAAVQEQNPVEEEKQVVVKKPKKTKREEIKNADNGEVAGPSVKKRKVSDSVPEADVTKAEGKTETAAAAKDVKGKTIAEKVVKAKGKPGPKKKEKPEFVEVELPQGTDKITVSGIELPPEDVGKVLRFLEYCSAFEKVLKLRKGQAECVIRELLAGRSKRRQQYSTFTQMIIQLLTVIAEDKGEISISLSSTDGSWFTAVGDCLLLSELKMECFPPELFEKGISEYEKMDSSKKLMLLNFLCDETLGTSLLRSWIGTQNVESKDRKKEAREKINAAKDKEKQLKQKLQDELAKAVTENNGNPLTIAERDAIVSRLNEETKQVQSEMQSALDMLSKKSEGNDGPLGVKPVENDDNGCIFWRFKSCSEEQYILVQDLGSMDGEHEKWSAFSHEQKPEVDKYLSYVRMKRIRAKKDARTNRKSKL